MFQQDLKSSHYVLILSNLFKILSFRRTPFGVLFFKTFDASFGLFIIRRIKWQRLEELYIALVVFRRRLRREAEPIPELPIREAKHFIMDTGPAVCQVKPVVARSRTEVKAGESS